MAKVMNIKKNTPSTWEESLQAFLFWKHAQGLSERTLLDYRKHVSQLFNRFPMAFNPQKLIPAVLEYMAQQVKPIVGQW